MRFRGKEACHLKPNEHSGEKNGETFTAFRMESQTWAGAVHDKMLEVLDTAEANEGRVAEVDIRNGGLHQDAVDAIWVMDRRLCQLLVACTKGGLEELRVQFGKVWVQGMGANGQSTRPKDRCRQIRGLLEGGAQSEHEWAHINKPGDVAKREEHHADVEQEAAEFETKYA